jgi:hypothetical protein
VAIGATLDAQGSLSTTAAVTNNGTANFGVPNSTAATTQQLASLSIGIGASGATASITPSTSAASPKTLKPMTLTFGVGATLDITDNILISSGTPTQAEGMIINNQVTTTDGVPGHPNGSSGLVLGYGSVTGGKFEIRATLLGDSDLDGQVNVADLANLAGNFGVTTGALWLNGDFDYNGNVNVADLADLAGNFGQSLSGAGLTASPALLVSSVTAVPEPGTLPAFFAVAALCTNRRRRPLTVQPRTGTK